MVSSSSSRFIDAALQATGDQALPYVHGDLKWLIRDHLLSLIEYFSTLSPHSDTLTNNDGSAVRLLNAHGVLPVSSSSPPVFVTIWLPRDYPLAPPLVYVFPTDRQLLPRDHPFVKSSGVVELPYLRQWQCPKSNLAELVRNLVQVFRKWHPYASSSASPPDAFAAESSFPSKREAMDRLFARLHGDVKQFQAQVEAEVDRIWSTQAALRERARATESALRELEGERRGLTKAAEEKANDADVLSNWLLVHGIHSLSLSDGEVEGFEPADATSRGLLENEAAAAAIDDVVDVLDQALAAGALDFGTYIRQVRGLSREQFYHHAILSRIQGAKRRSSRRTGR